VVGASGYAGAELLRLCAGHPVIEVVAATADRHAGERVGAHTPSLAAAYPGLAYERADPERLAGLDVVFCALPHGESQRLVPGLLGRVVTVVDLAADFRLKDPALYPAWYGAAHEAPELLGRFTYGLPELYRDELCQASLVAAPGCYPTAAALALAPFTRAAMVEPHGIVVDAASGVSGAGRSASDRLHFAAVDEDFTAYGLLEHRHTPEIEQTLAAQVLFTPHLAPMVRGILATCYARPTPDAPGSTDEALAFLREAYAGEPFVVVTDAAPSTKATLGSNCAHVSVRVDPRTGWLVALCALDNLVKGAAGQALQCANLSLGLAEDTGLARAGTYP
jgi:N-acetyl-gamma-glutamyl-phosphate reductase